MVQRETIVSDKINKALNKLKNCRVFRNHRGFDVVLKKPYGLIDGAGDRIGWFSVVVTPEMVGQTIAVFLSLEVKSDKEGQGKVTPEQWIWFRNVLRFGGIAVIARSVQDTTDGINGVINKWGLRLRTDGQIESCTAVNEKR